MILYNTQTDKYNIVVGFPSHDDLNTQADTVVTPEVRGGSGPWPGLLCTPAHTPLAPSPSPGPPALPSPS